MKPSVLLVWGYHRKNWVYPFEQMHDIFDFTYLFYVQRDMETRVKTKEKRIYWEDFSSAKDLLNQIKPKAVVFMSIDSPLTISLNTWSKRKSIPTVVLQHGIFHNYDSYVKIYSTQQKLKGHKDHAKSELGNLRTIISKFFLKSIRPWNLDMLLLQLNIQIEKRRGTLEIEAHKKYKSKRKEASHYLVFTKTGTDLWTVRDGIEPQLLQPVGSYEMDLYHEKLTRGNYQEENYFLLIDSPLGDIQEYGVSNFGASMEELKRFYIRLGRWCQNHGAGLKVKLHPYSYANDYSDCGEFVEFLRDTEIEPLIGKSKGVFAFFSSLVIPAMLSKKTILFDLGIDNEMQKFATKHGVVKLLDFKFKEGQITFDFDPSEAGRNAFIEKYVYRYDGKNLNRLSSALKSIVGGT